MFTWEGVVVLATLESLGRYRGASKVVLIFVVVHLLSIFYLTFSLGTYAYQERGLDMGTPISPSKKWYFIHGPQSCSALAESENLIIPRTRNMSLL